MSSVEERLARDIAAVTGRIVMTEPDLREAREEVDRRIDGQRQRDRRRVVLVATAAATAAVVGLVGWQWIRGDDQTPTPAGPVPSPTSPPTLSTADAAFLTGTAPTQQLLNGVWREDNPDGVRFLLVSFTVDGEVRFDDSGRLLGDGAAVIGSYELADDLVTVHVENGKAECDGQSFAMRAALPQSGRLRLLHTQPGTGNCSAALNERWELEQVLPTNEDLKGLKVPNGGAWAPPENLDVLRGTWMAEGGGHVLELTPEGTYAVADDSGDVVDRGLWSLGDGRSSLSLVSGADSPTCSAGARLVLAEPQVFDAYQDHPALKFTQQRNDCGGAWGQQVWVQLSHP
jgi:hypothetical protein